MAHEHLRFKEDIAGEHTHGKQIRVSMALIGTLAGGDAAADLDCGEVEFSLRERQFSSGAARDGRRLTARGTYRPACD